MCISDSAHLLVGPAGKAGARFCPPPDNYDTLTE
jgi:hypothetical protein